MTKLLKPVLERELIKANQRLEEIMSTYGEPTYRAAGTRPLVPALGRIYPQAAEWGYLLLRVTAGLMLLSHGWPKLMMGPAAVATNIMARRGIEPALLAAYLVMFAELVGGILITIGLFTRVMAAIVIIEFLVIVKVHYSAAGWMAAGGAEYPFLWLVVFIFILLRGGGPYSVDRKLGWEV